MSQADPVFVRLIALRVRKSRVWYATSFSISTDACAHMCVPLCFSPGYEHLKTIEALPTDRKDRPLQTVAISRCGELELQKRPAESADGQSRLSGSMDEVKTDTCPSSHSPQSLSATPPTSLSLLIGLRL